MNTVAVERNGPSAWNVTLPNGEYSVALDTQGVVERLKHAEEQFQAALNDIKARRVEFEKKLEQA